MGNDKHKENTLKTPNSNHLKPHVPTIEQSTEPHKLEIITEKEMQTQNTVRKSRISKGMKETRRVKYKIIGK